ncbi:fimbrial protein [Pseudomonas fluorescens]|uniref:Fimbrial-type adhesion domain-containing protein n=1 Tax=Pseudomonas fluorescens TaxID=294 RepID=A0A7Z6MRX5_PSEFL|nr:fimbrial protein [Pseudomonas fluorescens]RDS87165.1 hypothetical protein DL347_31410 [Pseudomonas fluorescens]
MKMTRLIYAVFQVCAWLMVSTSAYAVCGMMPNYQEGAVVDITMGRISVPSGVAVGDVFYSKEFPIVGSFFAIVSCKPGDTTQWRVVQGTATTITNVYTTNVAGVGMRTSWIPAQSASPFYAGEQTTWKLGMPGVSGSAAQNTLVFNVGGTVVVELIKLSDTVGSGALAGGTYTNNTAQNVYPFNSGVFLTTRITGGGSEIVPETGTCSIGDLSVDLAPAPFGRFTGQGSTTGDTPFNVPFTCSGANGAVTLTLDADKFMPDGSLGLIKPQAGVNNASCVALQVLDATSGLPAILGATQVVGTVFNNSTSFNLPYLVRYYQSSGGTNCVTPGLVKGTATVTVKYQ